MDPKLFRDALGRFLSGVTVVLAEDEEGVHGMTASAFVSVSLDPPLVLVSVMKKARMHDRIPAAGAFTISILAADQEATSNHFAGRPNPEMDPVTRNADGRPVIAGALAWIDTSLEQAVPSGDHTLYIGRVRGIEVFDGQPIGYWRGGYRQIAS